MNIQNITRKFIHPKVMHKRQDIQNPSKLLREKNFWAGWPSLFPRTWQTQYPLPAGWAIQLGRVWSKSQRKNSEGNTLKSSWTNMRFNTMRNSFSRSMIPSCSLAFGMLLQNGKQRRCKESLVSESENYLLPLLLVLEIFAMLMFMLFLMIMKWHVLLLVEEIRYEWIGVHPSIFRVFYIQDGAGFLPSTVALVLSAVMLVVFVLLVVALLFLWHVNTTFRDLYARWTTQGMILHSPKHDKAWMYVSKWSLPMNTKHVPFMLTQQTCAFMHNITFRQTIFGYFWPTSPLFCQTQSPPKKHRETRCPVTAVKLLVRVTQLLLVHQSFKRSSLSSAKSHEQRNDLHTKLGGPKLTFQGLLQALPTANWLYTSLRRIFKDQKGSVCYGMPWSSTCAAVLDVTPRHKTQTWMRSTACALNAVPVSVHFCIKTEKRQIDFVTLDVDCCLEFATRAGSY